MPLPDPLRDYAAELLAEVIVLLRTGDRLLQEIEILQAQQHQLHGDLTELRAKACEECGTSSQRHDQLGSILTRMREPPKA
ncbi:hypothetical protein [Methylobacterium sp. ID0610]|uniref:hypothetical protein n=1 Tax=Methylobacterium carpenticola TaxID=3344827 RepID=UPI0036A620D6